jgi:predicted DCC family thiol-disulfide oxidoreductase YuxK
MVSLPPLRGKGFQSCHLCAQIGRIAILSHENAWLYQLVPIQGKTGPKFLPDYSRARHQERQFFGDKVGGKGKGERKKEKVMCVILFPFSLQ